MHKGFTLVELIIVVIVAGILATFAVPQFAVTQERALDREAISVLGLIRSAEIAYRMEKSEFYPSSGSRSTPGDTAQINRTLRLSLPNTSSWNYNLASTGVITATRTSEPRIRTWRIDAAAACDMPTCSPTDGTCLSAGGCS